MNKKRYDELSQKVENFEITDNDFSWFDSCEGVSPESLSKDYDRIYNENKPIKLNDILPKDILTNIDKDEFRELTSFDFNKRRPPTMEKNGIGVYDFENDIVLIKRGDDPIGIFYVYQLENIRFRKGEVVMNGWDYDIFYDIKSHSFEETYNR